ncbi:MAG: hypothetical protein H0T89_22810 [Deltaproteobacteria bacterium]|nr:hypothetical protein [Deltaproteobacteria bacterium]MDQ3298199.1 hypothetical protein [Myxococcota bacterium]
MKPRHLTAALVVPALAALAITTWIATAAADEVGGPGDGGVDAATHVDAGAPARDADLGAPIGRDAAIRAATRRDAGVRAPVLHDADLGASTHHDAGADVPALLDAGVGVPALLEAGAGVPALLEAGVGVPALLDAGVGVPALLEAGVGVRALLGAGVGVPAFLEAGVGVPALLEAGVETRALLDAGVRVHTLVDAGVGVRALVEVGVTVPTLIVAGVRTLVVAGVGIRELIDAGVGVRTLRDAGVSVRALLDAGLGVRALVDAAVGVRELLEAGVGVPALIHAGVSVPSLVEAGVTAPELAAVGIFDNVAGVGDANSGAVVEPPSVTAKTTSESTLFAIKVIGGLVALLMLAYLGAHHRVVRFQARLGISGVITAGFPFVALGVVAALPSVGILTGDVLENMRPLLLFGLGWLGFIIGAQLDIRVLERVPRGTAYMLLVESLLPFVLTAAACGGVMIAFGSSWRDLPMWRDVVLLGAAAAMTAPRRFRGFSRQMWREGRSADVLLTQLDELVGVIGLVFITAYFRTSSTAWQLPDTAWIFVSLGIGVVAGTLIFAMLRIPASNVEFLAVVLGGIAFASGFAGYLRLSPIVVCFIAGVLVTNFPNDARENVFRILRQLERPVHLLFLIIAGAVWSVTDWRGWVLVPVFVLARVAGKWLGIVASRRVLDDKLVRERTLITPLSVLSIALVISVENTYSGNDTWIVTAVIGGAIVSELLVVRRTPSTDSDPDAHIDELDKDSRQ